MITNLRLQNYRSYKDNSYEFASGVNIAVGPNGAGKTNLLEAILVLTTGKSYRAKLPQLIKLGKPWARLDGYFDSGQRTLKLTPTSTEFLIDEDKLSRLSTPRQLPVVLFEPSHLLLLSGEPAKRRDWVDGLAQQIDPSVKKTAAAYNRSLAQRNALLKNGGSSATKQIFAWDVRISELGGVLAQARQATIDIINKNLTKPHNHISGNKLPAHLEYSPRFPINNYASKMLATLGKTIALDLARGFTGVGPHREDITAYLNNQPIAFAASRGETRSLTLALKIVEKQIVEQSHQTKPILLLDDVFSELDGSRRHHLVDYLKGYQTIITTTDADSIIEYFGRSHNLIAVGKPKN